MTNTDRPTQPRHIMRLPAVCTRTGFGRSHIYNLMKEGKFPQSKRLGARAVGWDSLEVEQWIAEKLDARGAA